MIKSIDCLIIGAGPSGLTLGIGLLRLKKTVLIVEKHETQLTFSKAILVNTETLQCLEEYGVTSRLREAAITVNGFTLYCWDHTISAVEFDTSDAVQHKPIFLPQATTEQCLQDVYIALGGQLVRGYCFDSNDNNFSSLAAGEPIHIILKAPSGPISVQCSWLFGCDGAHSSVRSALHIDFPGLSDSQQLHVIDAQLNSWPFPTHANLWLAPSDTGGALLILERPLTARIIGATRTAYEKVLQKLSVKEIVWDGTFTNSYRVAKSYGRGNVWLVGDAAHVHSPLGGRGMNIGITEAVALVRAIQTQSVPVYEKQCRPKARTWVLQNYLLTQLVLSQWILYKLLRMLLMMVLTVLTFLLGPKVLAKIWGWATAVKVAVKKPANALDNRAPNTLEAMIGF